MKSLASITATIVVLSGSITLAAILLAASAPTLYLFAVQGRQASAGERSAYQQAAPGGVVPTPLLVARTAEVIPTPTPIPPGVTPAGIPPTVQVPPTTPKPGTGHVTGRVLCNGLPRPFRSVYLFLIEGDLFPILEARSTDENGRWLFANLSSGTYAVSGDAHITSAARLLMIDANQITDVGDLNFESSCD